MLNQFFGEEQEIFSQDDSCQVFQAEPHSRYDLRPRPVSQKQKNNQNQTKKSSQKKATINQPKIIIEKLPVWKVSTENKEASTSFRLESELGKIKVPITLLELLKNPTYKESFMKLLQPAVVSPNIVNLQDDRDKRKFWTSFN